MVGPRPAGPPWTPEDDRRLMAMVEAGVNKAMVARKLKRTVAAIISRPKRFPADLNGEIPKGLRMSEFRALILLCGGGRCRGPILVICVNASSKLLKVVRRGARRLNVSR